MSLKMYFGHAQTVRWCAEVAEIARRHPAIGEGSVELAILPSHPSLAAAAEAFAGTGVRTGAQNLFWADAGPYTGEVSGAQLREVGCAYAEVGHAERRRLFREDDETVARKVAAALRTGLVPIVCIGETERLPVEEAAATCVAQLDAALADAAQSDPDGAIVVAYEPVWAIGADAPAGPEHIAGVCDVLKDRLASSPDFHGRVIYGGSAGPGLLGELGESVDGLFLGRFAHDTDALARILDEASTRVTLP